MPGRKFFPLLVLAGVACGDRPTEVILPPEPEPEDVTLTFVMPYPHLHRGGGPGVEGATITCLEGCPESQSLTTDSTGNITFLSVYPPLTVEARRVGYVTRQVERVGNRDSLVISHVWPEESTGTFERLLIPKATILHWGPVERGWAGVYSCPVVVVRDVGPREYDLHTLEHELFHAHQDSVSPGRCTTLGWLNAEEGKAYIEAWEADLEADRLFPQIDTVAHYQQPRENPAAFYAWWAGESKDGTPREDLCIIAVSRCQFMEDHFGPRPDGYP